MSELEHFDEELLALDQRIARLAALCGADLTSTDGIVALIRGDFTRCRARDDLSAPRRQELRALLMLKYRIEQACIGELGADACRRIVDDEHDRLRRAGFTPPA
ncbi:MAG: hypothetical protein AB7Q97_06615 [Gammaproteobacteria bacterium]